AGDARATVTWTPPSNDGGAPISNFTATAIDSTNSAQGGQTCVGNTASATQCVISGLSNGDNYTFTVTAANSIGTSSSSSASNSVTPRSSASPGPSAPPPALTSTPTPTPTTLSSLALSPASLTFGNVQVGQSATLSFQVQNTGASPLTISAETLPSGAPFSATTSLLPKTTIAANSSLQETVQFSPTTVGAASDTWVIVSDAGNDVT